MLQQFCTAVINCRNLLVCSCKVARNHQEVVRMCLKWTKLGRGRSKSVSLELLQKHPKNSLGLPVIPHLLLLLLRRNYIAPQLFIVTLWHPPPDLCCFIWGLVGFSQGKSRRRENMWWTWICSQCHSGVCLVSHMYTCGEIGICHP